MQMEWEHEPQDLFSYLDYLKRHEYNLIITVNAASTISLQTHCGILMNVRISITGTVLENYPKTG